MATLVLAAQLQNVSQGIGIIRTLVESTSEKSDQNDENLIAVADALTQRVEVLNSSEVTPETIREVSITITYNYSIEHDLHPPLLLFRSMQQVLSAYLTVLKSGQQKWYKHVAISE